MTKEQEVRSRGGRVEVRTVEYSYHALRRAGEEAISLFRYDNVHPKAGHPDRHHRHSYDERGLEREPPLPIGAARWPTLGEVIKELYEWWYAWRADRASQANEGTT